MFKYINYLFNFLKRKLSFYILFITGFVALVVSQGLMFIQSSNIGNDGATNVSSVVYYIPIIAFSTLFSLFIYGVTFKDREADGSEITARTMQISLKKVFLAKTLLYFSMITINAIIYAILAAVVGSIMSNAQTDAIMLYAFSILAGSFVLQTTIAPIIILLGTFMTKSGLTLTIMSTLVFLPMISLIMSASSRGNVDANNIGLLNSVNETGDKFNIADLSGVNAFDSEIEDTGSYGTQNTLSNNSFSIITDNYVYRNGMLEPTTPGRANLTKYDIYASNLWYDKLVYTDIWYQWTSLHTAFNKKYTSSNDASVKYVVKKGKVDTLKTDSGFMVNDEYANESSSIYAPSIIVSNSYTLKQLFENEKLGKEENKFDVKKYLPYIESFFNYIDINDPNETQTNLEIFLEEKSLTNRIVFLQQLIERLNNGDIDTSATRKDAIRPILNNLKVNGYIYQSQNVHTAFILYKMIEKQFIDTEEEKPTQIHMIRKSDLNATVAEEYFDTSLSHKFTRQGSTYGDLNAESYTYYVVEEQFIPSYLIAAIWFALSLLSMGMVIWKYTTFKFVDEI